MTKNDLLTLMQHLEYIFDIVRLVDVSRASQYIMNEHHQLVKQPYECHAVWKRGKRCDNCISAKALIKKSRLTKFEVCGDEVYHVIAKYVEVNEQEYVLEMVSKITDEVLFSAYGESEFAKQFHTIIEKCILIL